MGGYYPDDVTQASFDRYWQYMDDEPTPEPDDDGEEFEPPYEVEPPHHDEPERED